MRRIKIMFVLLLALSLSGCIQKYNFTEEKSEAVAECMAGLLLKYDADYKERLLSEEELEITTENIITTDMDASETDEQEAQQEDDAEAVIETEAGDLYTLSQVIGHEDCEIQYTGYKLVNSYPEDSSNTGFVLTPSRNEYQLLVVSFNITNKTKSDLKLSLIDSDITYQLNLNDSIVYKPLLTLLENDLQYIDISIEGGESEAVLLIFEIEKEVDMSNATLIVSKEDKSNIIEIK